MSDVFFGSIYDIGADTATSDAIRFIIIIVVTLALGMAFGCAYQRSVKACTPSLVSAIALLPAIVSVVIMMVDGNLGTGIAVAGAFSLVRFRSAPGSAREIVAIFAAMALGLISAMGVLGYAVLYTFVACAVTIVASRMGVGGFADTTLRLTITVPENLDFEGEFDDILARYTTGYDLVNVKTTNMGSLYKLAYDVSLADGMSRKALIDELRIRNGNLEISLFRREATYEL